MSLPAGDETLRSVAQSRNIMKTQYITAALRNAASPAARLAAWQNRPITARSKTLESAGEGQKLSLRRSILSAVGPELSAPEAETPLLWVDERSREILEAFAGREFLRHRGWFTDEYQDETLETYAVILTRFPRLVFYAVKDSCNDTLRVDLSEWQEIDFSECGSDYDADQAREDTAREVIRSNDSSTQREAEESIEYYRKDRAEMDIEENKAELKTLRHEIRDLCRELKTLCPSALATDYPAAGKALKSALASLLADRRRIMAELKTLAASL